MTKHLQTHSQTPSLTQNPPRRRIQLTCPELSITEPDEQRAFSMASIKKKLDMGIVPVLTDDAFYSLQPLKYTNLQDALAFHQEVQAQFEALPSSLRKLMGNNIHNFEPFLKDPKNAELLKQYGLVVVPDTTNQQIVDELKDLKRSMKKEYFESVLPSEPQTPPKAQK